MAGTARPTGGRMWTEGIWLNPMRGSGGVVVMDYPGFCSLCSLYPGLLLFNPFRILLRCRCAMLFLICW